MRYLAATDGSEESDEAVRYAARHALAFDATLELVHVLTPEAEIVDGEVVLPGEAAALDVGERILEEAREVAHDSVSEPDRSLQAETNLLAGRPAEAIAERAREAGVDAIYVGHRGETDERRRPLGSVAKSVVDRAEVPVTIIR